MTNKIISNGFKTNQIDQILESFDEVANTIYYGFASRHIPYAGGDSTIPTPNNSVSSISSEVYRNMIFGKKIDSDDIVPMVRRYNWEANTVYDMYSHDSPYLDSNNFFVVVDEGSNHYVYKCLDNASGANSTIQPTFSSATQEADLYDIDDGYYQTSDGYKWKFMYSISSELMDKFATNDWMPVVANSDVANSATAGSIDVITIADGGSGYDCYYSSIFASTDLRVTTTIAGLEGFSNRMYSLGDNRTAANTTGTIATTAGGTNVAGTGTLFVTDFSVGDYIKTQNTTVNETNRIISVTNNTLLTVSGTLTYTITGGKAAHTYPYSANPANDFYNYCILKITGGTAVGEYRKIVDFVNDGSKKIAVLESAFTTPPDTTSTYEVSPVVNVYGTADETLEAEGRAIVNSYAANSISSVEVLEKGLNYAFATANVQVSNVVPVSAIVVLKPIISSPGGHGFDPLTELGPGAVGISFTFANSENDRVTTENDYRQVGIIRDPLFKSIELGIVQPSNTEITGSEGTFLENENIKQFTMKGIIGTVSVTNASPIVVGTNTNLIEYVDESDQIIIRSGNNWFTSSVNNTTNSTYMTVSSNLTFTNAAAELFITSFGPSAVVTSVASGLMTIANTIGFFEENKKIIGLSSYAVANVANVYMNGYDVSGGISAFNQMTYYSGTRSGTFTEDEQVFQTTANNRTAYVHSTNTVNGVDYLYVTNQVGEFDLGSDLVGENSNAVFSIVDKYDGDVVVQSGEVIYLQNGPAISRSSVQTEKIKIVIEL